MIRSFVFMSLISLVASAQSLISLQFEPQVIIPGQTASVPLQVQVKFVK